MNKPGKKIPCSYRFVTSPGLELLLKREITGLVPGISSSVRIGSGVLDLSQSPNLSGLNAKLLDGIISRVALRSKLTKRVYVSLGSEASVQWEKQMREVLSMCPWGTFYYKAAGMPEVKVKSANSRIFAPKYVTELGQEAFRNFKGHSVDSNVSLESMADDATRSAPVYVRIDRDKLNVSIDAIGGSLNSQGLEPFKKNSRLDLDEVTAVGCIMRSLVPALGGFSERTTLWDPFCGNGVLPLMVSSVLADLPAGSPAAPYMFRSFPRYSERDFASVVNSLVLNAHPKCHLITVLGTDASCEAIKVANRNLIKFRSQLPSLEGRDLIPFDVQFQRVFDAYSPPAGDVFITTALPVQGDTERKYLHFHKMINLLEGRLKGAFVVTSKWNQFRKLSPRRWITELRFFDGRRQVEVLKLAS